MFLHRYYDENVFPMVTILDLDREAADWLATQRARLGRDGLTRPLTDGLIAATAVTRDLTLVTRNIDDFDGYEGLRIENWFEG